MWRSEDLLLEVDNTVADPNGAPGSGIEGMRTRLGGIGGHLDTGRMGDRFLARARLPYLPTRHRS